jgi:hypothetical protein
VESNLKGRELGYKDWIWFPENNILAFQSDVEPKLYPHGYSKFVREEIYQAALDKLAELTNQVNKLDREFPLIVLNEAKTTDKITQLEKANAELIRARDMAIAYCMQPTRNLEELYAEKLYEINTKQAKIIAELKSTVSFYADKTKWNSAFPIGFEMYSYTASGINAEDLEIFVVGTREKDRYGGKKARGTLARVAQLESGRASDEERK